MLYLALHTLQLPSGQDARDRQQQRLDADACSGWLLRQILPSGRSGVPGDELNVPTMAPKLSVASLVLRPGAQANTVRLPLHLNLAACDLQLGEWFSAIDNCGEVSCLLSSECMHTRLGQIAVARLECPGRPWAECSALPGWA